MLSIAATMFHLRAGAASVFKRATATPPPMMLQGGRFQVLRALDGETMATMTLAGSPAALPLATMSTLHLSSRFQAGMPVSTAKCPRLRGGLVWGDVRGLASAAGENQQR